MHSHQRENVGPVNQNFARVFANREPRVRAALNPGYKPKVMSASTDHIDKPEPRWQALLAFLAVGAIYLALPRDLILGPIWLLPTLTVVLLIPTVVTHRAGKRSLNRPLGILISGITTLALIASVVLLA